MVVGGAMEWGHQLVGVTIVGALLLLAILALLTNVRIEWDEDTRQGHRRKELKITRRPRRRVPRNMAVGPQEQSAPRRLPWRRRRSRQNTSGGA